MVERSDMANSFLEDIYPLYDVEITTVTDAESPYAASVGETLYIDASSGAVTVTFPEGVRSGQRIKAHIIDSTNAITFERSGSDTLVGATQFEVTDIDTVDYEFIAVGTAPADWKFTETVHRTNIEGYADSGDASTLNAAQSYADTISPLKALPAPTGINETDSPYTATAGEFLEVQDGLGGNVTINLPDGAPTGSQIVIYRLDSYPTYTVTVQATAGAQFPITITNAEEGKQYRFIKSAGTNYWLAP